MNLFPYEPTRNLLPFDGIANYYSPILTSREAQDYLEALLTTIRWKKDEAVICGKHIVTTRRVAWYGVFELLLHLLRNDQGRTSLDKRIASLKRLVEEKAGCSINSFLCNLYRDGSEGMAGTATTKRPPGKMQ